MRPLTDTTPKPLLEAGGKSLIMAQIEALARGGFADIVINVSHLPERLVAVLGNGAKFGATLRWSFEPEPLEVAGGMAKARSLLAPGPALIVSGDISTAFDYGSLRPRAEAMARDPAAPRVHLVLVPNPSYHPDGDFALVDGRVTLDPNPRYTYANIGLYDTELLRDIPRGVKLKLLPYLERWIAENRVSGELFGGRWANVGTPEDLALLDRELRSRASVR